MTFGSKGLVSAMAAALVVPLLAAGCGEQPTPLDRAVDQVWLDHAGRGEVLNFCGQLTVGGEAKAALESELMDDYDLDLADASVAAEALVVRCEAGAA